MMAAAPMSRKTSPKPPGSPDPLREMKQQVAAGILARLAGWNQAYAAELLGTWQPRMSDLRKGRLDSFSLDQLLRYAIRLEVVVRLEIEWLDSHRFLFKMIPRTRVEIQTREK
jgi:predicted XRE-type DNA-binding protein